jgi:hypothetical protein
VRIVSVNVAGAGARRRSKTASNSCNGSRRLQWAGCEFDWPHGRILKDWCGLRIMGAILPDYHSGAWQHVSLAHPGSLKTPW